MTNWFTNKSYMSLLDKRIVVLCKINVFILYLLYMPRLYNGNRRFRDLLTRGRSPKVNKWLNFCSCSITIFYHDATHPKAQPEDVIAGFMCLFLFSSLLSYT